MAVVIRQATPGSVLLPRILGGHAAAPEEWELWSEEPGHDLVAQEGTRVVGGIHVSLVGGSEAWLENLRVHPDVWGQGIAARLVKEGEGVARHYGAVLIRTAVPTHDYAAQAVAERAGYKPVLRCAVVQAPLSSGPAHIPYDAPVETLGSDHTSELVRFIESTASLAAWRQLLPLGWRFRRIVPDLVRGLLKDRRGMVALQPGSRAHAVQAVALFGVRRETVVVSLVDGSASGMQAVFGSVAEEGRSREATRAVVFTADTQSLKALDVPEWTPHPWCPEGLLVDEKSLAS